ncbi:MAG TPA: HEPN domain-containing protein [Anaerolineales bacterium]|nr:HEPN domain-containing protein [Anaerolineales bacterium]
MSESKNKATRERMKQARETLKEAEILFGQDFWRGTINRAYYAMFYAVLALAASQGEVISKHTHAISFLDKEFVKKGIFPKEISRALHVWFDERQTNDYGEIWDIEYTEAETALQEAKSFVKTIEDYLKKETGA